ncbi:NF-kappa-B essential modulator [Uranotaenia lowii]|uniref:NF-kappa-B essential modulator n=1 Tax=Uranotaenia lowii TaxID=190385 RepID=UPI0024788412|nr:NF-kappa-B essential modulator [Uranotaenia lowii]
MSDEESFIVLGSTPTPSMENYFLSDEQPRQPMTDSSIQINSSHFSMIHPPQESLKNSIGPKSSLETCAASSLINGSVAGENPLAASVIMGETHSSLFQTFPSLMKSSMPIDEVKVLQHLMTEHGQMKESLQMANVAMRKNFTSIQKWQDDVKNKYANQNRVIDELRANLEQLESANKTLQQKFNLSEENVRKIKNENDALQKQLNDVSDRENVLGTAHEAELQDLRKELSEKKSVLQNMAKEIERLQLEKRDFVVVPSNKPDQMDLGVVTKEEHERQIKVLQREMSVAVAKNLEFEDMRKIYVDEINCLKANISAAEEMAAKHRLEKERMFKDLETRDVSLSENIRELKTLSEQVDVLTAQLDIYKIDFEAERTARAELASEKDQILSDLKLLQKRNQQLIEEVQNGRSAEQKATRAANEALDKRNSPEVGPSGSGAAAKPEPAEEQKYERPVLHCPLCNGAFKDLLTLQNHVEDCVGCEG